MPTPVARCRFVSTALPHFLIAATTSVKTSPILEASYSASTGLLPRFYGDTTRPFDQFACRVADWRYFKSGVAGRQLGLEGGPACQ
jgi:hypothetical protein